MTRHASRPEGTAASGKGTAHVEIIFQLQAEHRTQRMAQITTTIVNKLGLHARAAAKFVSVTGGYGAQVRIKAGERNADGKSIMAVMMLAARQGTQLEIDAHGDDAEQLLAELLQLIEGRFGEEE